MAAGPEPVEQRRAQGAFVGRTEDPTVSIGVVSDGATVVAYATDGREISTWFRGPLLAGGAVARNADGESFRAIVSDSGAADAVTLPDGRDVTFSASTADDTAGLFRSQGISNGVMRVDGWIVQNDGATLGRTELSLVSSAVPPIAAAPPDPIAVPGPNATTTTTPTTRAATPTTAPARRPIAATGTTQDPVLAAVPAVDSSKRIDPTPDDVAPATPNAPLRFVIGVLGDGAASGDGAPDTPGTLRKPDLVACRDEANAFATYDDTEFAALGRLAGIDVWLLAHPGATPPKVDRMRAALDTYRRAETAARTAEAALAAARTALQADATAPPSTLAQRRATVSAAEAANLAAARALETARRELVAATSAVAADADAVLPAAIRNDSAFVGTGGRGPFTALTVPAALTTASARYGAFWTAYATCRPPVRWDHPSASGMVSECSPRRGELRAHSSIRPAETGFCLLFRTRSGRAPGRG